MQYEDIFNYIGQMGWYQFFTYCLVGLLSFFSGYQNMGMNFLGAKQDHWCKVDRLLNFSHAQQRFISIPMKGNEYDSCRVYDLNYSSYSDWELLTWNRSHLQNVTTRECNSLMYSQSIFVSTITSEYNLVCDRAALVQLVGTLYNGGMVIGGVLSGAVSDKIGRMRTILIGTVGHVVFGLATAATNSYLAFAVLRFITAIFITTTFLSGFVVAMEVVGPRWRVEAGALYMIFFSAGFMTLPAMAYFVRDFRKLQIVMAIPPAITILLIWVVPESPRWLIATGRHKEAEKILRKGAAVNEASLPEVLVFDTEKEEETGKGTLVDLFKTQNMRKRTIIIYFIWFTCSLMYYGLSMNTAALSGDIFLNTFLSGAVEVPANLICVLALNKAGRRLTVSVALLIGAAASFSQIPLNGRTNLTWLLTTLSLLGKAAVTTAFSGIYVFSAELYPTEIRNVGIGSSSTISRISGMAAPYVGGPLGNVWGPLPAMIFGVLSALSGFTNFFLPETLNKTIPETIKEAEVFGTKDANKFQSSTNAVDNKGYVTHLDDSITMKHLPSTIDSMRL